MTRACQCGGIIRQHHLHGDREAWTCNACGRYGAIALDDAELRALIAETVADPGKPVAIPARLTAAMLAELADAVQPQIEAVRRRELRGAAADEWAQVFDQRAAP